MRADDPRHGTNAGYSYGGCREQCCKKAHARAMNLWRMGRADKLVPALGTHRRIQALMTLGWSGREMSRRIGHHRDYLAKVLDSRLVSSSTARKVADLYDALCMTLPPQTSSTTQTRNLAQRKGYAPPLAYDDIDDPNENPGSNIDSSRDDIDEAVVLRLLAGERMSATKPERDEAMRRWLRRGGSEAEFCRMHGWKDGRYGREVAA